MRGGSNKGFGMLALFLITGAVLGGIIGEIIADSTLLAGVAPYLVKQFLIFDLPPVTINLYVIKFVIGFALYPNLISLLGMVAAAALFRRF
jgi:hypothetical protein